MYQPNYIITDQLLKQISEIESIRSIISQSVILPTREAEMRYRATVEATHSSTSIEGNPLNLRQVNTVLSGHPLLARNEYAEIEVRNYKKALDFISRYDSKLFINLTTILELHRILTQDLLDKTRSGHWRQNSVYIENQSGEVLYIAAAPEIVVEKMSDLLFWLESNKDKIHPIIAAALLHHEFVSIHPFADGNGRAARTLTMLLLKHLSYDFRGSLVLDSYYSTDKAAYYRVLHHTQGQTFADSRTSDLSEWLSYFVEGFLASVHVLEAEVKLLSSIAQPNLPQRKLNRDEVELISYATQFGAISIQEATEILSHLSRRTVQRILHRLVEQGIFIIQGSTKDVKYKINRG